MCTSSLEDCVDSHIADRIVWALGGPYFAMALRSTSRQFRALIAAPSRVLYVAAQANICAMIGDVEGCRRALARIPQHELVRWYVSRTAAEYNQHAVCDFLFDLDTNMSYPMVMGAASAGNLALCKVITKWERDYISWHGLGDESALVGFFGGMAAGAIRGNRADMLALAAKWSKKYAPGWLSLSHAFLLALAARRMDMLGVMFEWKRALAQEIDSDDEIYQSLVLANTKPDEIARKLYVADKFEVDCVMREVAKSGSPAMCAHARDFLSALDVSARIKIVEEMMTVAIQWSPFSTFVAMYEWLAELRARNFTLRELSSPMCCAAQHGNIEVCEHLYPRMREQQRLESSVEANAKVARIMARMLEHADECQHEETSALIRGWIDAL